MIDLSAPGLLKLGLEKIPLKGYQKGQVLQHPIEL